MDICEGCEEEFCSSPCAQNVLPTGTGREETECPYYDDCERCKKYLEKIEEKKAWNSRQSKI